jgi:Ca2+-binding RTX toxin-like protein
MAINGTPGADSLPGTAGNEVINGGAGNDTINGAAGNDTINGGPGNDLLRGGIGNDLFLWIPGDNSDTIAGGAGFDTLQFDASPGMETMELSAIGGQARLTRNVGAVTMDLDDVERIRINALGAADTLTVNNLAGTDVTQVAINLGTADGASDFLAVNAGGASNAITLTKAAGVVSITGLQAKITLAGVESLDALQVNGQGGNDVINASALPFATALLSLNGGAGHDKLTGSKGEDSIQGGTGNDTIAGGLAYDAVSLGEGDDLFLWTAGDGGDAITGDLGIDTLRFSGNNASEAISIFAGITNVLLNRDGAEIVTTNGIERFIVNPLGGADNIFISDLTGTATDKVDINLGGDGKVDTVFLTGGALADFLSVSSVGGKLVSDSLGATVTVSTADKTDKVIIEGGDENDLINASGLAAGIVRLRIEGGLGNDTILGSAGNDTVNGGLGNDLAFLGGGNDRYVWTKGDEDDTIDGQGGTDTLQITTANVGENMFINAVGERVQITDFSYTLLANSVERLEIDTGGGFDVVFLQDLTGTDVKEVVVNLGSGSSPDLAGGSAGSGNDIVTLTKAGSFVSVAGLPVKLLVTGGTNAAISVGGGDGNDKVDASAVPADLLDLALDGGTGNDTVIGGKGNDGIFLGTGNDLFLWNPGQGSDSINGDADFDTVRMTGSAGNEIFGIKVDGFETVMSRGSVELDTVAVERLQVRALGGADRIIINDLTGSDARRVDIDLAAVAGGTKTDGKVDIVSVAGTVNSDFITVSNSGGTVVVDGIPVKVNVTHADKTDRLIIDGGATSDFIDASGLAAGIVALQIFGGAGGDLILGSAGNDTVTGGIDGDKAVLGAGNDLFIWSEDDGNDIIEGGKGTDTLRFNGDAVAEFYQIGNLGGHAILTRDIDAVTIDMIELERIQLRASDGGDTIIVNDVSGTDLKQVAIDLGASDGDADTVFAIGRAVNESITVALAGAALKVTGMAAEVSVTHAEAGIDLLRVYAASGNDTINASTVPVGTGRLWLEGADGNDTITGGAGNERLDGDQDNDVLNGGGGKDTLFGGSGNDRLNGGNGADSISGSEGNDTINGGNGADTVTGGEGNDTIDVSLGNDIVRYTSVVDGRDVISGFDGNAAGGQDVLDLEALFDALMVAGPGRAARVSIVDNGASVQIRVDTNGDLSFDLAVATLKTSDAISIGQDVLLGS